MQAMPLETAELTGLAGSCPGASVFGGGRAFVLFVRAGLYEAIAIC